MAAGRRIAPRTVEPEAVLTQTEIQQIRARIAQGLANFRAELQSIESALIGGPGAAVPAVVERPRVSFFGNAIAEAGKTPGVTSDQSVAQILATLGTYGLREASYSTVVPVTAPKPIDNNGEYYDAGEVFDAWILNPSVDTKFDFDKPPSQNTPFISANSRAQFQLRKQRVYYLPQNTLPPGTTGTLQIWLFKY